MRVLHKRDEVVLKISGQFVRVRVLEVGQRLTTLENLATGRLVRVKTPKPKVRKVAKAAETVATPAVTPEIAEKTTIEEFLERVL